MKSPTNRITEPIPKPLFSSALIEEYCRSGHHRVAGWLHDLDAQIIRSLGRYQSEHGSVGGTAEIGVYHGRLFILLCLLLHTGERAVAIDTFEADPASGGLAFGDRAHFEANLANCVGTAEFVRIIQRSSDVVSSEEIIEAVTKIRLFSVDGLHSRVMVESDLALADRCLSDQGIVIVDDCFNPITPGVSDGMHDYFQTSPELVPFAISLNKVFLCRPPLATEYRAGIKRRFPAECYLEREFLGQPVDIYRPTPRKKRGPKRWLKRLAGLASLRKK